MTAPAADSGAQLSGEGLRPGVLKVRHAVITSLAVITPAAAILFLPIPIAANAGAAMPLSIVVAFVVVLVIMNAVYRFSQRISHAGSFFAFVRDSLGVPAGFVAGWLFLAFYPVFVGLDLILFGATLNGIIVAHGGPDIPWWLLMLIGLAAIWGVAVLGIRLSVRSDLALLTFELGVLLALALTIFIKGAPGGNWHPHVFSPGASPTGWSGVVVGAVFGVLAFTGFEAPAYLGEEAADPRRTVPRAILVTTAGIGIAFVFFFYVTTVGWGHPGHRQAARRPGSLGHARAGLLGRGADHPCRHRIGRRAGGWRPGRAERHGAHAVRAGPRRAAATRARPDDAPVRHARGGAHPRARGGDRDGTRFRPRLPAAAGLRPAQPGRDAVRAGRVRARPVRPGAVLLAAG